MKIGCGKKSTNYKLHFQAIQNNIETGCHLLWVGLVWRKIIKIRLKSFRYYWWWFHIKIETSFSGIKTYFKKMGTFPGPGPPPKLPEEGEGVGGHLWGAGQSALGGGGGAGPSDLERDPRLLKDAAVRILDQFPLETAPGPNSCASGQP